MTGADCWCGSLATWPAVCPAQTGWLAAGRPPASALPNSGCKGCSLLRAPLPGIWHDGDGVAPMQAPCCKGAARRGGGMQVVQSTTAADIQAQRAQRGPVLTAARRLARLQGVSGVLYFP